MEKKMASFMFFDNFKKAIDCLESEQDKMAFCWALTQYADKGIEPDFSGAMKGMWVLAKIAIDNSIEHSKLGKKGAEKRWGKSTKKKTATNGTKIGGYIGGYKVGDMASEMGGFLGDKMPCHNSKWKGREMEREKEMEKENKSFTNVKLVQPQADCTRTKSDKKKMKLEFEFYLWCFNKLFEREFTATEGRLRFYKQRRKKFELVDIITSLQLMSGEPFYRGEGQTDRDNPWRTSPDFHLRKDENIAKFLELENASAEREYIMSRLPALKKQFMANYQVKNRKENKNV